jgi:hypothetical protein
MSYALNVEDLYEDQRLYRVECWEPPVEPPPNTHKGWGKHHHVGVVCRSAVEAIGIVAEKHPRYRIDAVNQTGVVHIVVSGYPSKPRGEPK